MAEYLEASIKYLEYSNSAFTFVLLSELRGIVGSLKVMWFY